MPNFFGQLQGRVLNFMLHGRLDVLDGNSPDDDHRDDRQQPHKNNQLRFHTFEARQSGRPFQFLLLMVHGVVFSPFAIFRLNPQEIDYTISWQNDLCKFSVKSICFHFNIEKEQHGPLQPPCSLMKLLI
ncbi:hypothetical protein D1872_224800 [compost metagenome]